MTRITISVVEEKADECNYVSWNSNRISSEYTISTGTVRLNLPGINRVPEGCILEIDIIEV